MGVDRPDQPCRSEFDDRYDPLGLLLVLGEPRIPAGLFGIGAITFLSPLTETSPVAEYSAAPDLDRHIGMRHQVVVPIRVGVRAGLRGKHVTVPVQIQVHHRD
jgi:hypothetical protein